MLEILNKMMCFFHSVMRVAVMEWASQGRSQGVNETPVLLPTGFYEVAKLPGVVAAVLSAIWRTFFYFFIQVNHNGFL